MSDLLLFDHAYNMHFDSLMWSYIGQRSFHNSNFGWNNYTIFIIYTKRADILAKLSIFLIAVKWKWHTKKRSLKHKRKKVIYAPFQTLVVVQNHTRLFRHKSNCLTSTHQCLGCIVFHARIVELVQWLHNTLGTINLSNYCMLT